MKAQRVAILFDSHTPYLAFRVNALQRELVRRGLQEHIELCVILTAANWSSYGWDGQVLQEKYDVPVHVLTQEFHGLGLHAFFSPSLPRIFFKLASLLFKLRPRLMLTGGYDRPASLFCRLLSYFFLGKVGVMNDSRFNDAESFNRNAVLEFLKSLVVARYSFFMCAGQESADYHHFLGGKNKPVFTEAWNVVDNDGIAKAAEDAAYDSEIYQTFGLELGTPYFFFPARFVPKKNVPFVLHSYAAYLEVLKKNGGEAHCLVLCGQGPEKGAICQAIEDLSLSQHVKVCDWLPYEQMPRACRLATSLVLASTHDQWGMTVNESLSAGTPVLVSNRCGAHELVQNDVNGFTFAPSDAPHLTALLLRMHHEPELTARLRREAAPSMRRFSITQYLERHLQLFALYGLLPANAEDEAHRDAAPLPLSKANPSP
jgi:glycosyltransferase involved in cell wall biosynthesis